MRRSNITTIAMACVAVVGVGTASYVAAGLTLTDQPGAILPIPAITTTAAPEGTVDDVTLIPVVDGDDGSEPGSGSVSVVGPAPATEVDTPPDEPGGTGGTGGAGGKPTAPPGLDNKPDDSKKTGSGSD